MMKPSHSGEQPRRLSLEQALEQAEQVRELAGEGATREDHTIADQLVTEAEIIKSLEGKNWAGVFAKAESLVMGAWETNDRWLGAQAKIESLTREKSRLHKNLSIQEEDKEDLQRAQEFIQENLGKILVREVYNDHFWMAVQEVEDEMVQALPKDYTWEQEREIYEKGRSLFGKISDANEAGVKEIELVGVERKICQEALPIALANLEEKITATRETITQTQRDLKIADQECEVAHQQIEDLAIKLRTTERVLDQLETSEGSPRFDLKSKDLEEEIQNLLTWRKNRYHAARREGELGWGLTLGDKWALYWEIPEKRGYILLNPEDISTYVHSADVINCRLPGTILALYSESVYLGGKPSVMAVIGEGIPRHLAFREREQIEERLKDQRENLKGKLRG